MIMYHDTASWCSHGVVMSMSYSSVQFICACAVPKMTVKTSLAKTEPAGPLATAMEEGQGFIQRGGGLGIPSPQNLEIEYGYYRG